MSRILTILFTMRNLDFFIVVLCYFAAFQTASSQETDTLKQGDFLDSSNQSLLVSANKLFVLGFYSPPSQNPPNLYLTIWYNAYYTNTDYTSRHPVWIGNRNTPIRNTSALLFLNSFGNLFINGTDDSFPLYSPVSKTRINATATLLDSGNFVVREINSNGSAGPFLWQSFDYPTDTLLPEMKLGVNQRTGKNLTLTSWFSDTSPRDGAFSLEWDPQNRRLVIRHRGVIHWTSGSLKDRDIMSKSRKGGFMEKVFEFFRPDTYVCTYEFITETNEDEDYFYYRVHYQVLRSYSNTSAWLLDYEGTMYDTKASYRIAVLDSCYGTINRSPNVLYYAQGCESWEQPKCRNNHLKFVHRPGEFRKPSGELVPSIPHKGENISSSDCREVCWRDCNCFGYLFNNLGCQIWQGQNLKFHNDSSAYSTARQYVLLPDEPNITIQENPKPKQKPNVLISEASKKRKSKKKKWIPFAAAALVSLAILLFGLAVYMKRKRRQGKEKELLELMTLDGYTETVILKKDGKKGQDVKLFSYSCIVSATNNFSPQNKLGQGGFGPVYKGQLPEGQEIAVKRLSKSSEQGLQEFKTELLLIAKLQHTNLVRLFGCCIHGDEKMLIYEYMPNKSLDFFLFEETSKHHLCWERRFIIIEGIAQGLLYLHKYSRLRIIHRDLKASNILLDENMNPKISDFGTARIFKKNLSEESTIKITGTRGYMAPEYILEGTFSIKSDVFSFGVLMLEIVSGRKNNSLYDIQGSRVNLVAYAWELWNRNSEIELMDLALSGSSGIHDQVQRCIRIGLLCVQHSAILRPTMSEVISMLSNDISALPVPGPPAFFEGSSSSKGNTGSSSSKGNTDRMKSDKNSETGLSISEIRAR